MIASSVQMKYPSIQAPLASILAQTAAYQDNTNPV
jgi:hypothetical protein